MNDNDIIKALEHCINSGKCMDCMYAERRCIDLTKDALDLITRQKVENKELKASIKKANAYFSEGEFAKGIALLIRLTKETAE